MKSIIGDLSPETLEIIGRDEKFFSARGRGVR
jgi:hypothetical protein